MTSKKMLMKIFSLELVALFMIGCIATSIDSFTKPTLVSPTSTPILFTPKAIPTEIPPTETPTAVPPTPTESGPEEISWKDARMHVGSTVKVCGEIFTVMNLLDNRTVLNLGELPKNGGVIIVIRDRAIFPEEVLDSLYRENICVTGEIVEEESNVGIFVTDPPQIESSYLPTSGISIDYIFRDDFTDNLQPDWEWQNENPSRWEITTDGWLQILGDDDSLLANGKQNNLLCRDVPNGDFQITVHIFADPTDDFQQATLFLYQNGDNYIAINRGFCSPCGTAGNGMFMEIMVAGNWRSYEAKAQDPDVFLRLEKQGNTITGYYAFEDGEWLRFGEAENNSEYSKICLGVSNVDSAGIDANLLGRFDYIEISRP